MLEIKYEREVGHCAVSPYVKEVTITEVFPAVNSDKLDCVKFAELGWNAVAERGLRQVGDKVLFVPAESVIPFELSELLNVTKYLSKGRIRVTNLRGNRSEGLIVPREILEPYLPYILKWEDLPSVGMDGEREAASEVSLYFHKFYKMPNILNEPTTFDVGETLIYSEKIHGTNWRVGILPHPQTELNRLYTGSHEQALKPDAIANEKNVYVKTAKQVAYKLPSGYLFFGEIAGPGIQKKLTYGNGISYRMFAATKNGRYLPNDEFIGLCNKYDLNMVEFKEIIFKDIEQLRELSEGNSQYGNHIKEGCVFISKKYPERMAKCISSAYLELTNRSERH